MKLELFDAYNIRARLSASIILLAPIATSVFMCFQEITTLATGTLFLGILMAFANYVPIMQRRVCDKKKSVPNYAARFLHPDDSTIDPISKKRYYCKLQKADPSFALFGDPQDSEAFKNCCSSAIVYLRNHTRDNNLVQEESINYGFCKNLVFNKNAGIIICLSCIALVSIYSWIKFKSWSTIPTANYFSIFVNTLFLVFWIFGVTKKVLKNTAKKYAITLLSAVDSMDF